MRTNGETDRRTNGRRNITKLIDAFRNFVKAPKSDVRITTHGPLGCVMNIESSLRPGGEGEGGRQQER